MQMYKIILIIVLNHDYFSLYMKEIHTRYFLIFSDSLKRILRRAVFCLFCNVKNVYL